MNKQVLKVVGIKEHLVKLLIIDRDNCKTARAWTALDIIIKEELISIDEFKQCL